MKTLKKILSVVLVVAMLASMLIVGAAAADEKTNYEEAVAVVMGLGIIEGDETGYHFQDNVTRAQAAKIISYLLLGKDVAETLETSTAPFADVAANHWAAGFIAYLKGQGIISGVSDTEFDPNGDVTGVALAKMLLTAVGYGKNGEFEGASWDINTITLANQLGVYEGTLAEEIPAAATREECMLYAFNTLTKVATVNYNKTFESYYTGTSALQPVVDNPLTPEWEPYEYTLAWTNYKLTKSTNAATNDIFGRPCASWVIGNTVIAPSVANKTPDAIFYGTLESLNIYDTFGKAVVDGLNKGLQQDGTNDQIFVYYDGVAQTKTFTYNTFGYTENWVEIKAGEHTNAIKGAVIELYLSVNANNEYELTIVACNEHIGEVTRVNTVQNFVEVTETLYGFGPVKYYFYGTTFDITGLAKEDMVKFTYGNDRAAQNAAPVVASITEVEPVLGTYTGSAFDGMFMVIDGTYYSTAIAADATAYGMQFDNTYELYLDCNYNILRADLYAGNASFDYLYVSGIEAQTYDSSVLDGAEAKVALKVVYPNGGYAVSYYTVNYAGAYSRIGDSFGYYITVNNIDYPLTSANVLALEAGTAITDVRGGNSITLTGWYSFVTSDAGTIALKNISNNYANVTNAISVAANFGVDITGLGDATYSANSKTVLTKVDAFGSVTVYNGVKNFPTDTIGSNASVLYTYDYGTTTIKNIVVYTGMNLNSTQMNLAYCAGDQGTTSKGTTYTFYVNGEVVTALLPANSCRTGGIYDLTNVFGTYSAVAPVVYGDDILDENENDTGADYTYGTVNAANYSFMNMIDYLTYYYEWATVASVDENWFVNVAVDGNDQDEVDASVAQQAVPAVKYYYDANTIFYDCTNGGAVVDGIEAGDVFVAYVDEAASLTYGGQMYCTYIWIVG